MSLNSTRMRFSSPLAESACLIAITNNPEIYGPMSTITITREDGTTTTLTETSFNDHPSKALFSYTLDGSKKAEMSRSHEWAGGDLKDKTGTGLVILVPSVFNLFARRISRPGHIDGVGLLAGGEAVLRDDQLDGDLCGKLDRNGVDHWVRQTVTSPAR